MPISKARRAANDKWDKKNMTTLGCKVKKTEATAFKEYSLRQGKTTNTVLREYVTDCIKNDINKVSSGDNMPDTQGEGDLT